MGGGAKLVLLAAALACLAEGRHERMPEQEVRRAKIFNVFQVVNFPNDPCMGSGTTNGTCYTQEECDSRSGVSNGICADGFGVCCTFTIGCGQMSSENCTYFSVNAASAGSCQATICPCNNNICQLRLDFTSFAIEGPSTSTTTVVTLLNGAVVGTAAAGATPATLSSNCLTDAFTVTSPGAGTVPPTICGTNTGEHMYLDASNSCNDLTFAIGSATSAVSRSWNIKVTQYSCNFNNLAPDGCTQYFFGSTTGNFESYNFQSGNGRHLANQQHTFCFRRESGQCRFCVSPGSLFMLSNLGATAAATKDTGTNAGCCSYGTLGTLVSGYDCVELPGAKANNNKDRPNRLCGRAYPNIRCTVLSPFVVRFMSDGFEFQTAAIGEAAQQDEGFNLMYAMDAILC